MRARISQPAWLAIAAIAVIALSSCAGGSSDADEPADSGDGAASDALTGELTVYAAASLTAAFDEFATEFEQRHPDVDVLPITYDGSSTLATQLEEGAPADVFASADTANMDRIEEAGLAEGAEAFATNTLVLVVPAGNPGGVENLADLADPNLTVVLCAPEVPCGAASETLLSNAGVTASVDSAEQNVTAVLTKVASGEADAGLVYVTDAATTDGVESIVPEGAEKVVNTYPIVALNDAANVDAADAFVAFVRGEEGQAVLAELGFGAP